MSSEPLTSVIIRILSGEASEMRLLKSQIDLERAGTNIPEGDLVLMPSAVRRVLTALLQREITPNQAQAWASFVRRGFIPTDQKAVRPLNIGYEEDCEDDIAEAVSRMDELGDIIDGTMDDDEIRELIQRLEHCERTNR